MIEKVDKFITKISIPFEDVFTTSFIVDTPEGCAVFDTGSSAADAEKYILPTLQTPPTVIALSHTHNDHSGGLGFLAETFPRAMVAAFDSNVVSPYGKRGKLLCDGKRLLGCLQVFNLKGHSADSAGVLDLRTKILLTFDSLQLFGISRWRNNIENVSQYLQTLDRLENMQIERLIASHKFDPLGSVACGKKEIENYIRVCRQAVGEN